LVTTEVPRPASGSKTETSQLMMREPMPQRFHVWRTPPWEIRGCDSQAELQAFSR